MDENSVVRKADIENMLALSVEAMGADELEKVCIKEEQVNCPVIHRFSPGIYIREVFLPKDTFAIGHMQKTEHLNIFLKGRVVMYNEGRLPVEMEAPVIYTEKPGRKCVYMREDVVWLNVYPTEERDVEKLEATFLDKTPVTEENRKHVCRAIDNHDYCKMRDEYGFEEEALRAQSENTTDRVEFPYGGYSVSLSSSDIEGTGLFASGNFKKGEDIAPARIGELRTPAGVYTNHSIAPNAAVVERGDDIYWVANRDIQGCCGGHLGEEITINYRDALGTRRSTTCQE